MRHNSLPLVAAAGLVSVTVGMAYWWQDRQPILKKTAADPEPQMAIPGRIQHRNKAKLRDVLQDVRREANKFIKRQPRAMEKTESGSEK